MTDDPWTRHDRRLRARARPACSRRSTGPRCSTRPTSTSPPGSARSLGEEREEVLLAAALAVRAVRQGSVCVDLDHRRRARRRGRAERRTLPWPDAAAWLGAVAASPLVARGGAASRGHPLYLDRYWREEGQVCDDLVAPASTATPPEVDDAVLERRAAAGLPGGGLRRAARRRRAAAARRWTTVLTGGPGTGKTTTVAGLLALVAEQHERPDRPTSRIALLRPTGKASARLQEAVEPRRPRSCRPDRPGAARRACRRRRCTGCSAGGPTARPVPAPPHQPAARTT